MCYIAYFQCVQCVFICCRADFTTINVFTQPEWRVLYRTRNTNMVNFAVSPAGHWQTRNEWWEVVQSRFQVDLKSNFAQKNNSMDFLLGPITRRINAMYESSMKWIPLQVSCWRGEFLRQAQSGTPSTIIYTRWSSRPYGLGCHTPTCMWRTMSENVACLALTRKTERRVEGRCST